MMVILCSIKFIILFDNISFITNLVLLTRSDQAKKKSCLIINKNIKLKIKIMRHIMLLAAMLFTVQIALFAQTSFTSGNLVVVRYGENGVTPASGGISVPIYVDEYSPAGQLVKSIEIPGVVGAGNAPSISEGALSLSADGSKVSFLAYKGNAGIDGLPTKEPQEINRILVMIGTDHNSVDASTTIDNVKGSPRAAVVDGDNGWFISNTGGLHHIKLGQGGDATQISRTPGSGRALHIVNGDIYVSTNAGSASRIQKTSGLPVTSSTIAGLPDMPNIGNPYGFVFFDMDPHVEGVDLLYVADDSNPYVLQKYSFDGISWAAKGQVEIKEGANKVIRDLTGTLIDGKPTLYGTTLSSVIKITDNADRSASFDAEVSLLVKKKTGTKEVFKGISFTPGTQPVLSIKK